MPCPGAAISTAALDERVASGGAASAAAAAHVRPPRPLRTLVTACTSLWRMGIHKQHLCSIYFPSCRDMIEASLMGIRTSAKSSETIRAEREIFLCALLQPAVHHFWPTGILLQRKWRLGRLVYRITTWLTSHPTLVACHHSSLHDLHMRLLHMGMARQNQQVCLES